MQSQYGLFRFSEHTDRTLKPGIYIHRQRPGISSFEEMGGFAMQAQCMTTRMVDTDLLEFDA